MTVSDGVSPSPKRVGSEPARPSLNPPLELNKRKWLCKQESFQLSSVRDDWRSSSDSRR